MLNSERAERPEARSRHDQPRLAGQADPADAFGVYHDLVNSSGAVAARVGDVFETSVTATLHPGFALFDRQIVGIEHHRGEAQIRQDGFEHYYLQVLRSGRMAAGQPGDEQLLGAGDAMLMDATLPQRTLVPNADYVTVVLARDLVERIVPDARHLHGRVLPRIGGQALGAAVLALAREAPRLRSDTGVANAHAVAAFIADIAGRALSETADDPGADQARRMKANLFINAHLHRSDLDAATIARGTGTSRSALYRAFRAIGGVEREIVRRRAARLRARLLQPDERRPIANLAHDLGFKSASHCSRIFKSLYGMSPAHLRLGRDGAEPEVEGALRLDRMRAWYRNLNLAIGAIGVCLEPLARIV